MTEFDPPLFRPLFRNPHVATVAAAYWPRELDTRRFPVEARLFPTAPDVKILVHTQSPPDARGDVVMVHGLEGSSEAGYMRSLAQRLLQAGFAVHRTNIRSCGGTEFQCRTLYHSGLTSDLAAYLVELDRQRRTPAHLVGFSLGGNQVLKLAGELGSDARRLIAGVAAISTPIDLKLCSAKLSRPENRVYTWRFLAAMKKRLRLRAPLLERPVPLDRLDKLRTVWDFDDVITGPFFGFRGAEHYYDTQSAKNFLSGIAVPALIVHAEDDPMIDIGAYRDPALEANPRITALVTRHGGHIGFLDRGWPRIWVDGVVTEWMGRVRDGGGG